MCYVPDLICFSIGWKNMTTAIVLFYVVSEYYSLHLLESNSGKLSTLADVAKKDYSFNIHKDSNTCYTSTLET